MLRRLFAALMAIVLVGSSNNLVGAKGETKMVNYESDTVLYGITLTKDEVFNRGKEVMSNLAYDYQWCSLRMDPRALQEKIIEVELTVKTIDSDKSVYSVDYIRQFFFNEQLPDRFVEILNKQRFDLYVEQIKTTQVTVAPEKEPATTQVIIKVKDVPLLENYQTMVCQWIDEICIEQGFNNPALIKAMVFCESNFNPNVISAYGCEGLMQITPKYFKAAMEKYAVVDLCKDPYGNLQIGIDWTKTLVEKYNGDLGKVLVAYNLGESKVDIHGIYSNPHSEKVLRKVGDYM